MQPKEEALAATNAPERELGLVKKVLRCSAKEALALQYWQKQYMRSKVSLSLQQYDYKVI